MDPDANLREQREIANRIIVTWENCDADGNLDADQKHAVSLDAIRLAELVSGLDHWITERGFLPAAWTASTVQRRMRQKIGSVE